MRWSALALVALALALPLASAHAELQSAEPSPNGHAPYGITMVNVTFTESVDHEYTSVDVVDTLTGESFAEGPLQFDPAHGNVVHRAVRALPDGTYSVNWRTLSVDTHTARGTFIFAVGSQTLKFDLPVDSVDHSEHSSTSILQDGFARGVFYGGLVMALGLPVFAIFVDRPASPRRLFATAGLFAVLAAGAAALLLLFFTQRTQIPWDLAVRTEGGRTLAARGALVAAAGAALFAACLARGADARRGIGAVGALLALGALAATALGSHAAADLTEARVSILLDGIHLLMGAVWIGGIFGFVLVSRLRTAEELGDMVLAFTPLALTSVALLLVTGTYASLRHMTDVSDIWNNGYGRLVALKVLLLVPLIGIGYLNKERIGPALQRGGPASLPRFRRAVTAEAIVMVLILAAAGILASSAPPDQDVRIGDKGVAPQLELEMTTKATHVVIDITPNPIAAGSLQRVAVTLHPLGAREVPNATTVALKIAAPGEAEPEEIVTLDRIATNAWSTDESGLFTSAGNWTLYVIVQIPYSSGTDYAKSSFPVPVVAPQRATTNATSGG